MTTQCDPRIEDPCMKLVVFGAICVLPLAGSVGMLLKGWWWPAAIFLSMYLAMSLLAVVLYWWDKRQAQENEWRTPEVTLHTIELLGGWPGALIAQRMLRHKTRKLPFQRVFWFIILVHQVLWMIVCISAALT